MSPDQEVALTQIGEHAEMLFIDLNAASAVGYDKDILKAARLSLICGVQLLIIATRKGKDEPDYSMHRGSPPDSNVVPISCVNERLKSEPTV